MLEINLYSIYNIRFILFFNIAPINCAIRILDVFDSKHDSIA